jgi:hypothetical protein
MATGCSSPGCPNPIPPQTKPGRPRTKCLECSPPRNRPERRQPPVLQLHAPEDGRTAPNAEPASDATSVTAATLQRLTEAERLATPDGAVVMHLARLIDVGDYNAQGAAALAKAHAEALARATAGAKSAPDAIDELLERRAKRRGA